MIEELGGRLVLAFVFFSIGFTVTYIIMFAAFYVAKWLRDR